MRALLALALFLVLAIGWWLLGARVPAEGVADPSAGTSSSVDTAATSALPLDPPDKLEEAPAPERTELGGVAPREPTLIDVLGGTGARSAEHLVVRVLDPSGQPVPGTRVRAREQLASGFPRRDLGRGESDGTGHVDFEPYQLEPREGLVVSLGLTPPEGWAKMSWKGPAPTDGELLVELAPATGLSGSVAYSDGRPLHPGTRLFLNWSLDEERSGSVTTEIEDGRFSTPAALAGRVTRVGLVTRGERNDQEQVDIPLVPGAQQRADLVFEVGCSCDFTFVDASSGEPIVAAEVRSSHPQSVRTDADGLAHFDDGMGAGETWRLRFDHPDYPRFGALVACPRPSAPLVRTFEVSPGHDVGGVLVDVRGAPLPGVKVTCQQQVGSRMGGGGVFSASSKSTHTDAEGRFRLRGFQAGPGYDLVFVRDDQVLGRERIQMPDPRDRWLVLDLLEASGRVLDAQGQPAPDLEVRAQGAWSVGYSVARTDLEGRFRFEGLFPGPWVARVEYGPYLDGDGNGYSPRRIVTQEFEVFPSGAPRLELHLPPEGRAPERVPFVLRLFDAETGLAIESAEIVFMIGLDNSVSFGTGGPVGTHGFRNSLFEGRYDLIARCLGYEVGSLRVEIVAGGATPEFELELQPKH